MPINPQFLAARHAEHLNRLKTHLGLAEPIGIPLCGRPGRAFRVPQRLLTERMRLELILARNAFVTGGVPLAGDVFICLWRMHPDFCRPLPGRVPAIRALGTRRLRFLRLWYAFGSYRTARLHRWLSRCVAAADLPRAAGLIRARLALADQDAPGAPLDGMHVSPIAPRFCYWDDMLDYMATTYHVPLEAVLDLPRALVHQLYRNRLLSGPDGELTVFAPSDRLL